MRPASEERAARPAATGGGLAVLRVLLGLLAVLLLLVPPAGARGSATGAVPRASCGAGALPETGLQGQVPLADRESGRSTRGYRCNVQLVSRLQGSGTSWVSAQEGSCVYEPQAFPASLAAPHPGVQVLDVRDPAHPVLSTSLTSPAFLTNPWESLKANPRRHLLAGVSGTALEGTGALDVYDVRDCAHPRLLNSISGSELSLPGNVLGHEGAWSPDGRTYWATGGAPGVVVAIGLEDPAHPTVLYAGTVGVINHGLSFSQDGRTMYLATINPEGLAVLDVGEVQDRRTSPTLRTLSTLTWEDGANGQMTIPVTWKGRPYLVFVDEMGAGAVRIIDISDVQRPVIAQRLKLQIHLPAAAGARTADTEGTGLFGYEGHYCAVDRTRDPRRLACGMFQSGVRVFDVRDPRSPREVGYYNPPAQVGQEAVLLGSEHAQGLVSRATTDGLTTDWCSSPPRFVGVDQLWVSCQDNGFMVLRLTGDARPST